MGKSISMYQVVRVGDPKLQNKQSVDRCVQILDFLRLVMQVVLPKEKLCWLVYNGMFLLQTCISIETLLCVVLFPAYSFQIKSKIYMTVLFC